MQLGIKVDKVHKILTFDEKDFLTEYIDLNTLKNSKNDLEKRFIQIDEQNYFRKINGKRIK